MYIIKLALDKFIYIIELLILIRVIMSFIVRDLNNPIASFIYQITEPILAPARELIRKLGINTGMIDFSPLVALLLLNIVNRLVWLL